MFCGVGFAVCGEKVQSFLSTSGWDSEGGLVHSWDGSHLLVLLDMHQAFPEVFEMQIFSKVFKQWFWALVCPSQCMSPG